MSSMLNDHRRTSFTLPNGAGASRPEGRPTAATRGREAPPPSLIVPNLFPLPPYGYGDSGHVSTGACTKDLSGYQGEDDILSGGAVVPSSRSKAA